MTGEKPREIAARVLQRRLAGDDYVENLLENAFARSRLSPADRGLCQELVYGVARWQNTLDWLIARKAPGRTQKPMLQILLRLGLYQIFWLERIPNHAAVHETVEQAKQAGFGPQAGFVNAVLRGYIREFDATNKALSELKVTQPHLGYSHPEWLVRRWQERWGNDKTARLMEWNNTPPNTYARINELAFSRKPAPEPGRLAASEPPTRTPQHAGDLLEMWRHEEVAYDFVRRDWLEENLVFELKSFPPLSQLRTFRDGLFYVQDPSTLLAVRELNPQPGETVLDLCAAPGGKLTYIAQRMQNQGRLFAHDTSLERLKLVEENCARMGVNCVETLTSLSDAPFAPPPGLFHRVLIDAPCSNTGVMRRRVDLRWRIRPEELTRLRTIQLALLRQAARLLKPGGTLVYSTCSLEPEENREVVNEFLTENPTFKLENERELIPFTDDVDGAYAARLVSAAA